MEGSVEDVAPFSSFPRGQNPSLSPPNLFPIIYMYRGT
nr:MAG TPA: hypothetical protein [Caudoviricetes sp.]